MNVMFAANDYLVDGLELAIWTLLKHNHNTEVNIYVATMNIRLIEKDTGITHNYRTIDDDQRNWLRKIVSYVGQGRANITFIDCAESYHKYLENSVNALTGFTPYASIRLLADIIFPDIDDLLYLDADTAIQGPLESMYNKYIYENKYCMAGSFAYDAREGKGELVSGVLVMNLKRMREEKFLERARDNYNKNEYIYPDQFALEEAGECERLPETYGYMFELENCFYTPIILHFTNKLKPKIYNAGGKEKFYKRYPQFKYVEDGMKLLSNLDITF